MTRFRIPDTRHVRESVRVNPRVAEFESAIAAYKESSGRLFLTWDEVLEVTKDLGHERQERAQR